MLTLTYLQQYAYNVLKAGYNVFLTGGAGTGKSHLIRLFIEHSRGLGLNVMITAPTGIAAFNIDGVTMHRAFDIPLGVIDKDKDKYELGDTILHTDIIIIDEISMARIDTFDFIANKILRANKKRKWMGKPDIQLVLVGDFLQLPPVIVGNEKKALDKHYNRDIEAGFVFNSDFWKIFDFKYIILTEVVRQSNTEFIDKLNKVRVGDKSSIDYFYNASCKNEISGAITLCGTNSEADEKNKLALNNINDELVEYKALVDGPVFEADTPARLFLKLKVGARVMTLINDNSMAFINGSFGTVVNLAEDIVKVRMDNGELVDIERYQWNIFRYELEKDGENEKLVKKEVGTFTQFPLRLAYAITIHKSQGQTYDYINLSPYCWDCGQLYVALSRVRNLEGLHFLYKPDPRYLVISLNVIRFYNSIVKLANQNIDTSVNIRKIDIKKDEVDNDIEHLLSRISAL
ncbi:MAG: AAA family ATPase [Lachnospiraceae bacterium]|nr:AAA family ATPase [Lachnospiraceae bacterium]